MDETSKIASFYEYPTLADKTALMSHLDVSVDVNEERKGKDGKKVKSKQIPFLSSSKAPTRNEVTNSCSEFGIPDCRNEGPFCGNKNDVPDKGQQFYISVFNLSL